jgi:hypothetical protein
VDRPISHSRHTPNLALTPGQPPSSTRSGLSGPSQIGHGKASHKEAPRNGLGGIRWNKTRKRYEGTVTVASEVVGHDADGRPKYRQRRGCFLKRIAEASESATCTTHARAAPRTS